MKEIIACKRCGVCCKLGVYRLGKEDLDGRCIFLSATNDIYSCKLYSDGTVLGKDIGIGLGCVLRAVPEVFSYYEKVCDKCI